MSLWLRNRVSCADGIGARLTKLCTLCMSNVSAKVMTEPRLEGIKQMQQRRLCVRERLHGRLREVTLLIVAQMPYRERKALFATVRVSA